MPGSDAATPPPPDDPDRRKFLLAGTGLLGAGVLSYAAVPVLAAVTHPLDHPTTGGSDDFLPAGPPDRFGGVPVKVDLHADHRDAWNLFRDVNVGSAWVVRLGGELVAFSTVCPHLGCAVDYDPKAKVFKCPCHRSEFSLRGEVLHGPSPRPLDRLDVRARGRLVAIRYQRFKQGEKEKIPL